MNKWYCFCLGISLWLSSINFSAAQPNIKVTGQLIDTKDKQPLTGVNVLLYKMPDTTQWAGAASTDIDGKFILNVAPGFYRLKASFIGYNTLSKRFPARNGDIELGQLTMEESSTLLKDVTVEGKMQRMEQKGDTTQYNAGAYKTNPDASTEDLVNKMPGVSSQNGSVTVNGEQVQRVLVDGKPFFGDDPNAALRNLPAEVVDKIQVFDRASDQAQFTGFDDGRSLRTINIITKRGKSNGTFGKGYAGYGTGGRYIAGGNLNIFNGERRISVLGLTNNINQQNFASQDITGALGQTGGGGGGRGGGGGGGQGGGGGAANNFLVGQQNGITRTNAFGLNYSDTYGTKLKLTASYFYNDAANTNTTALNRKYNTGDNIRYTEDGLSNTHNINHRFNARLEYNIDTSNAIIITPQFNIQNTFSHKYVSGLNESGQNTLQSALQNLNGASNIGYNFNNNFLFRHKFTKRGRTFSFNVVNTSNNTDTRGSLYSVNQYIGNDTTIVDQQSAQNTNGFSVSPTLSYTEPLGKTGQLMFSYNPSYTRSYSGKNTYDHDSTSDAYSQLNNRLSSTFSNTYFTQNGGLSYRITNTKMNLMVGFNYQNAALDGNSEYPLSYKIDKNFVNVLPQAMFNYRFANNKNLRLTYRTTTTAPTVSQLQSLVNNTNTLLLTTGNPGLRQTFEQNLMLRFGGVRTQNASGLFFFANLNYINNFVASSTLIAAATTVLEDGTVLNKGSQLTQPVNMDGYLNSRGFYTYGIPVTKIKSNLNFNGGINYSRTPALLNGLTNWANNYGLSQGLVLSSNISEKVDFNLSYTANYTIVKNSLQTASNNNYFNQLTSFKFNWLFGNGFVFNTNVTHTLYTGLSQSYNQSYVLWNASFGYKFLKDKALEVKLTVFDILHQNNNISRNVTTTYIEDSRSSVLTQYFMVMATYSIKNFKGGN